MSLNTELKREIIEKYGDDANDTGSTDVQIALLTERIRQLTEHFKVHSHDHNSRRGLLKLVGQRRRLMRYLNRQDHHRYVELIQSLGIRG
ncbi:MAG: 30S ribosomal protein S15 [Caldilineae bacterium]|nr:30S ribosomal protein S15 [Chloroflexota bacterium]MCB9177507.1 30S ribosomal protein S15 [Caldilineae bacterium]